MALVLFIFLKVFFLLVTKGYALDQYSTSQNISLGSSLTLGTNVSSWLSPSGIFAFGFYKQGDGNFAVGIWLTTKPEITVVWTANRDDPPVPSKSTIEFTGDGWLLLDKPSGEKKYITNQRSRATSASMLDSGNLVLYYYSGVIWESFDYPTDTLLGGQNLTTEKSLVSSVSATQHSSGGYQLVMQSDSNLVAYTLNSTTGNVPYWASGTFSMDYDFLGLDPYNGILYLAGVSSCATRQQKQPYSIEIGAPAGGYAGGTWSALNPPTSLQSQPRGINEKVIFRATLQPLNGNFILYSHTFTTNSSSLSERMEWQALRDQCHTKGVCGYNSYCSTNATGNSFECNCFPGFIFINDTKEGRFRGCYRTFTDEESCSSRRELKLSYNITAVENIDLREYSTYSVKNLSKEACSESCLDDCNCWAGLYADGYCRMLKVPISYAVLDKNISATVFMKTSYPNNQVKDPITPSTKLKQHAVAERLRLVCILATTLGSLALLSTLVAFSSFFYYRVHARKYQQLSENVDVGFLGDHFILRSFSFEELQKATDGFKEVIGRNSYGEVYKGFISEGKKAVAVKRLERMTEGEGGFKAEIMAIAQTHHRNLVCLRGFCIHGAEKLLVYEFMSNGSLADLLFNAKTQRPSWKERVRVALDVARGILYLHEECVARIIHCNIEPHNIFFDESWTAKISDFGLSKLLRPNQSGTLTGIRGTRGYVAPEWHKNTLISTKADIYSFGVVLLEILCCTCTTPDMEIDVSSDDKTPLSTWVYDCFVAKELNKLVGDEEVDMYMLEKMVKVGLLCIQEDPEARPSIKHVILMLEGTTDIPIPASPTPPSLI